MVTIAPYGAWRSAVTTDLVAGQTIGLSALSADDGVVYWLESRPSEAGRTVLVRRDLTGTIADVTLPPFNVASRVHEYGGGAYTARDGKIVFSNKTDGFVWLIERGQAARPVTQVHGCRYADFRIGCGGSVAFCVREDHRASGEPVAAIVALDLTGSVPPDANQGHVLAQGADFFAAPRLSPDERQLCWISWNHPDMPWDATQLFVAELEHVRPGSVRSLPPRQVAGFERESVVQPDWSPDGALYFCSDRDGWWNVYRAQDDVTQDVTRDAVQCVAQNIAPMQAEIGGPHWVFGARYYNFGADAANSAVVAARVKQGVIEPIMIQNGRVEPMQFGVGHTQVQEAPQPLPDGRFAFIATPPDAPPFIAIGVPGHQLHAARAAGEAVLPLADIAVGQPITFPIGGGQSGYGFWYPPTNSAFKAPDAELPPLIVIGHGGPTGMSSNGFAPKIQWWTSRGCGVLDVNYSGSTGFGRAYRQRLDGQWGVADVADCIAGVRYLVAARLVDPDRVAIRGGSAGGFTVLMALTTDTVFRAGASHYGVADLRLLAQDTHKFESRYLDRLIGPLPEAAAVYDDRSPINRLDRLQCPVIFFQGKDDQVVPPNQARTVSAAMRARGLDAPLHEFEGEAHGFRRADTIARVLELETAFYGQVFGFTPAASAAGG